MNLSSISSGAIGAATLTLIHEMARHTHPDAPRMDVLGKRALAAGVRLVGGEPLPGPELHAAALGGDLILNGAYYSLVGLAGPKGAVSCGVLLGLAAGVGAVLLPGLLGLGTRPSRRTPQTAAMTIAWYTIGGVVAGAAYSVQNAGRAPAPALKDVK